MKIELFFIWTNLNPLHQRMHCAKFGLNWPSGSEDNRFSLFLNYLSLEKGRALHLNKLEFPSPKDALCQVWLKLTQWFWRRRWKCEKLRQCQQQRRTTDKFWSEKLTWAFCSCELKRSKNISKQLYILKFLLYMVSWCNVWYVCVIIYWNVFFSIHVFIHVHIELITVKKVHFVVLLIMGEKFECILDFTVIRLGLFRLV